MKLIDQTVSKGRHSVLLFCESAADEKLCRDIFRQLRTNRVLAGTLEQSQEDDFPSLRLEEIASKTPQKPSR